MLSSVETENAIGKTDKEEIITPYPEQEYDVEGEAISSAMKKVILEQEIYRSIATAYCRSRRRNNRKNA